MFGANIRVVFVYQINSFPSAFRVSYLRLSDYVRNKCRGGQRAVSPLSILALYFFMGLGYYTKSLGLRYPFQRLSFVTVL